MDYNEWAAAYLEDACRVRKLMEKKKSLLNDKNLNADARQSISDTIRCYRRIYYELLQTAEHLKSRGGQAHAA